MGEADYQPSSLSRLIAFSDSVFAFAITLLVIIFFQAQVPHEQFLKQLLLLKGPFFAYLVSFYSVGLFWLAHHRYFRYITKYDTGLFLINLVLLMLIAILPFPTYLLGVDGFSREAAAFYAGLLSLMQLLFLLLWWYASSGHRLVAPTLEQSVITSEQVRRLLQLSVFVVSIGLALFSPVLALVVWIVGWLPINFLLVRKRTSI